ncbi:MAG: DUF1080 domain-containing protein [Verrucomicrobia bacterium]|nr:DUF1080 domain-containing protein [Verrucomicrobiota bacterium]
MKRILIGLLVGMVSAGFADDGWKPLFDGKGFSGWTFDVRDGSPPETIWKVTDGTIAVSGKGKSAGVLRTEKTYSNYTLEFEWRWMNGKGNSGCLIHCSKPREMSIWPKSIEVQLASDNAGDFWQIGETIEVEEKQIVKNKKGQPSRRRLNLTDDAEKPLGEWNEMRVVVKDATVAVFVNGTLVNKGWKASATEGAICLQAEGANIQFRNIRIKE